MANISERSRSMKFVLDSMLGRLAKWLRIMGYDTYYQPTYRLDELYRLSQERIFITRNRALAQKLKGILLTSDHIEEQLKELKKKLDLKNSTLWLSRCIICNTELRNADPEWAQQFVPEYVYMKNKNNIKFCPSCKRFYWPGTHRQNMLKKLKELGF